jgi:hypothetical protein
MDMFTLTSKADLHVRVKVICIPHNMPQVIARASDDIFCWFVANGTPANSELGDNAWQLCLMGTGLTKEAPLRRVIAQTSLALRRAHAATEVACTAGQSSDST